MTTCAMLDLETLGTHNDCVILTIGVIKFDPFSLEPPGAGLYLRMDIDEQLYMGRTADDSTIEWWGSQDPVVRDEAMGDGDRVSVAKMRQELNKFLVGVEDIWAQGPVFDIAILEHLYRQNHWPIPWHYWQIRDSRTLFGVHGDPREKGRAQAHNALIDCYYQAEGVQKIYNQVGIKPRF